MARSRNIKPGFFRNELLVELPYETRLLFIGLWTIADREGRLEDRPKRIKMELFPADNLDVDECLNQLQASGFILRYVVGDDRYIQVVAFTKHQNPHQKEQASTIPAPDCGPKIDYQPGSTPDMSDASTVQAPDSHDASPADSLNTDSPFSDSGFPSVAGADAPASLSVIDGAMKNTPREPMPRHGMAQTLLATLHEDVLRIGPPTNYGRAVAEAERLAKAGCTPGELREIAAWLLADPFWAGKGITIKRILDKRDEWRAAKIAEATKPRKANARGGLVYG